MQKLVAVSLASLLLFPAGSFAQHQRIPPRKSSIQSAPVRPITGPQATIAGPATGVYCPDMTEKAVGLHDLGWLPSGVNVTVVVESVSDAPFDPVATVLVVGLGVPAGNTAKTTTFYDNDSGGDKDPQIAFVAPQEGTYLLLVGDNSGSGGGCYRYQVSIR